MQLQNLFLFCVTSKIILFAMRCVLAFQLDKIVKFYQLNINQQIVKNLQNRQESGLSLLYKHYSDSLYGMAYRTLRNEAFAEDCLQQAFLKIWNNIDSYDENKSSLYTWMSHIVKNTAIDISRLRSFQKESQTETLDPIVHINSTSKQQLDGLDVNSLLKGIDDKYSEVLRFLYLEGYSQSELAEKLDIPLGTIKTRAKKAIDLLRENLSSEKGLFIGFISITLLILYILLS